MSKHSNLISAGVIILSFCLMLGLAGRLSADFSVEDWQYYKTIENPGGGASGYAGVTIDNEIFARSKDDMSDLRVIDNKLQETPYKIFILARTVQETDVPAQIFNQSFVPGQQTLFTMDLGDQPAQRRNNRITIATKEQNFKNKVEVRGSNDQQEWLVLRNDCYIFDFSTADYKSAYTTLEYSENDYRYIKVSIMMGERTSQFDVSGATVKRKVIKDAEEYLLDAVKIISRTANADLKATELVLDLGSPGRPQYRIELSPSGANYHRRIELLGAGNLVPLPPKDKRMPAPAEVYWDGLGNGYIYNFNTPQLVSSYNQLNYRPNGYRYLKVRVYNYDDQPLEFNDDSVKIYGAVRRVVFNLKSDAGYSIYYGNSRANRPVYDIDKLLPYIGAVRLNDLNLGKEVANVRYVDRTPGRPWSEQNKVVLWIIVIAGILAMGYGIVKWTKDIKPEG
ncbi:MAG: DUF3999 family protein [Planctomycetota bacterium]